MHIINGVQIDGIMNYEYKRNCLIQYNKLVLMYLCFIYSRCHPPATFGIYCFSATLNKMANKNKLRNIYTIVKKNYNGIH